MKTHAIILGGGVGSRSKSKIPKQFIKIGDKTVLEKSVAKFNENKNIDNIILVLNSDYKNLELEEKICNKYEKVSTIVPGGKTRRESTFNGLEVIQEAGSKVLVHDAVRPFVSHGTINRCIDALDDYNSVYPGVESADTLISIDDGMLVEDIPIRKYMRRGQTPQGFIVDVIKEAHRLSEDDPTVDKEVTNDCGLVSRYGLCEIKVVEGNRDNIKITYPEDLALLKKLFVEE